MKFNELFFLLTFIFIYGCCENRILNLRIAKDIVQNYYESGAYERELKQIYQEAKVKIDKIKVKSNSIAIFDVDDTALSNYEIAKKLDFGYDYDIVQDWVMKAKLPAINPTLEFFNYLKSKGFRLFFLTGRQIDEYDATFQNLINQGYSNFDSLIVRSTYERNISALEYKSSIRKKLSESGFEIKVCIGDQWSDLEGGYTGIKIKLPNYLYEIK
jgi:acid phosphatase